MNMKHSIPIAACMLLSAMAARGQGDLLGQANQEYRDGHLREARALVDEAVKDAALAASPEVWVLRGFIYKDLYKEAAKPDADVLRDEALASLYTAVATDRAKKFTGSSRGAYWFLANTIYNDAVHALNNLEPDHATTYYAKYGETVRRMAPDTSMTRNDIDFQNALGTVYVKLYARDRTKLEWYDKALGTYKQVLAMDSNNYGANYNLATLYYNRGVYNIQRLTPENDIPSLQQIQEASREFFTAALPYMMKAHIMKPDRVETILGLENIHYSLQDEEKSRYYRRLFEELKHDEVKEKER
ncbi:MAG: hypothetical protein OZ932_08915 [Flavobacteriia bacterium]|nr:hypothetical protein [Flavobacteriia bacterium]